MTVSPGSTGAQRDPRVRRARSAGLTMVLDTSALVAMLFAEPEATAMIRPVSRDPVRLVGAPTLVEAAAVMTARKGSGGEVALDALLARMKLEVVPMTVDAARLARLAYARFGKGAGDPSGIAMAEREPLLFKGDDFARTDVPAISY